MIDCSHGNSQKQHTRQSIVAEDIASQLESESGETSDFIMGVMIESNLVEGKQDIPPSGRAGLKYGQSVTDACLSWEMTVPALDRLAEGVRARRKAVKSRAMGWGKPEAPLAAAAVNGNGSAVNGNGEAKVNGSA